MRVLQLTVIDRTLGGGVGNVVLLLSKELNRSGIDTLIVCREKGKFFDAAQQLGLKVRTVSARPLRFFNRHIFLFYSIPEIVRIIKEEKIDIVHSHNNEAGFAGFVAAKWCAKNFVFTVHGVYPFSGIPLPSKMIRTVDIFFTTLIGSLAERVIAVSEFVKKKLAQRGINRSKIEVIHNGIDLTMPKDLDSVITNIRSELKIPEKAAVVGTIGRLDDYKGYPYLIKAIKQIITKEPNVYFIFVGELNKYKEYQQMAEELGVSGFINFTGFREDTRRIISVMDIFVMPSLTEGFPLALLEAMLMSKPIVATDAGGIPEMVKDGYSAVLVPVKNSDLLAQAVIALLNDRQRASTLAENAHKQVMLNFSKDKMAASIKNLYESLNIRN